MMKPTKGKELDTATEGYRASLQMIACEGRLIWSVFGSMLAANAFVVTLIGAIVKLYPNLMPLGKVLPVLGILVCVAWILITTRQFAFYHYWFACGRHYESKISSKLTILQDGKRFANGESVTVHAKQERLSCVVRCFRVQWLIYIVVGFFVAIYMLLLTAPTAGCARASADAPACGAPESPCQVSSAPKPTVTFTGER
jgi:hypothetical protein